MENFEKITIGLVLFTVTSIIAYLFRMRQLYVVVPKLFRHSQISNEGSLCELLVYNKGNQVEEDIQVSLDPELKGELLASSSSDIVKSAYVESQLVTSFKLGWKDLRRYYDSGLRQSYSNQEFPIRLLRSVAAMDKSTTLEFEVYNKTALPLEVWVDRKLAPLGDISNYASVEVPPMSKALLSVKKPSAVDDLAPQELRFTIKFGEELIYGLSYVLGAP